MLIVIYGLKFILIIVLISVLTFFIGRHYLSDKRVTTGQTISFKVSQGQGVKEIARNLSNQNIIRSKIAFLAYAKYKDEPLLVGDYKFNQHQGIKNTYHQLTQGTINDVKITIPEGWRREQIAQLLNSRGITSYEAFMQASDTKEGQLFPDTYLLPKPTTASEIVKKMTDNYNLKTKDLNIGADDLIIASIIEREAKHDVDRPKVASVFYNRLAIGMKLQTDASVTYAVDNLSLDNITSSQINEYKFWQGVTAGQIKSVVSDYNTYQITGLPPASICNPGLKSLEATKNPASTDYIYFFSARDGSTYYAKTLAEHNRNITKHSN